eukprot:9069897-Pyramimonas_sp.AAC.1
MSTIVFPLGRQTPCVGVGAHSQASRFVAKAGFVPNLPDSASAERPIWGSGERRRGRPSALFDSLGLSR